MQASIYHIENKTSLMLNHLEETDRLSAVSYIVIYKTSINNNKIEKTR